MENKKVLIAPSILGVSDDKVVNVINSLITNGSDMIHYDVMDGEFVEAKSFSVDHFKMLKENLSNDIRLDVHLMVKDVERWVDDFIEAGADMITFHKEAMVDYTKIIPLINKMHKKGIKVGISINPSTSSTELKEYLGLVDLVLIMSVVPGKGGQSFMEEVLPKVDYLNKYRQVQNLNYVIEIDGGINDKTAILAKNAGVDILVAGSYILKSDDYKKAIDSIK